MIELFDPTFNGWSDPTAWGISRTGTNVMWPGRWNVLLDMANLLSFGW